MDPFVMFGRLVLAATCSGLIGYERETARKSAGLRTHTLVGVGAAIFSIASIISFDGPDEARIAAQIVTGVGFLGAGAIFRQGALVSGLTTAAGLWVAASIGMAAGSGSYWLASLGTLVTPRDAVRVERSRSGDRPTEGEGQEQARGLHRRHHQARGTVQVHPADRPRGRTARLQTTRRERGRSRDRVRRRQEAHAVGVARLTPDRDQGPGTEAPTLAARASRGIPAD